MAYTPNEHGFRDMMGGNKKNLTYEQLRQRAEQKRNDLERTKAWIQDESNLEDFMEVKPSEELALIQYYSSMPEVEVDPDVSKFWESNKEELDKIDVRGPQSDYLSAYQEWQNLVESMDDRRRNDLGLSRDFDYQEKQAREQIQSAKEREKSAREALRDVEYDVDPFKAMIGFITGTNKDWRKKRDARKSLKDAKKSLRDARRHLDEVKERRADAEESKNNLSVKEQMLLDRMLTAQERMEFNQETAIKLSDNMKSAQATLHQQFKLIDQYKSIQKFKTSKDYIAQRAYLKSKDKALFDQIESVPEKVPANLLKVTLEGPLKLPSNSERIAEIDSKITELQGKLPSGINMDDLATEIDNFSIKPTDTVASLETAMAAITDQTSKEYKQLEMKRDHLVLQAKVDAEKAHIETLRKEIVANDKPSQAKLKELQTRQGRLKVLQEELAKSPYAQTIANLQELQQLANEKEGLGSQNQLANIEATSQAMEQSSSRLGHGAILTVSALYTQVAEALAKAKETRVQEIIEKGEMMPIDPQQNQDNDGR